MEEILKYENRDKLYQFLIDDFGLVKINEEYTPEDFGNFYIVLSAKDFLLYYINDRSYLTIDIASKLEPDNGFSLSFVKDFLYNPKKINVSQNISNTESIKELNFFLKKDFDKIQDLFSIKNYPNTKKKINEILEKRFRERFP